MSELAKMTTPVSFIRYTGRNLGAVIEFLMAFGEEVNVSRMYKDIFINKYILSINHVVVRVKIGVNRYHILSHEQFEMFFSELTEKEIEKINKGAE